MFEFEYLLSKIEYISEHKVNYFIVQIILFLNFIKVIFVIQLCLFDT